MEHYRDPNDPRFHGETDSASIQNAVNALTDGIRTVRIPRENLRTGKSCWEIDKAILLPSDCTVILDGCHLILKEGIYDNIFRNENLYASQTEQHGIRILGRNGAVLDGGAGNDLRESNSRRDGRPHIRFNNFILLHNVRDYVLEGFSCHNMRWWAINQIACRHGIVRNIRFWNGNHIPNQDGIDVRIGSSDILIENISGRCGDDVVALTALPLGGDRLLLPEGRENAIHDVTVRNVSGNTMQTVAALRACDGARLYNIRLENISDCGGEYAPWGIVRIGENNYYKEHPALPGEIRNITVDGVRSLARGTVYLGASLTDSSIRNVSAEGTSMYAISTYCPVRTLEENGCTISGGVTMENVHFENIRYTGTAGWCDDDLINDPTEPFSGCALDFRCMHEDDTLTNVTFRNVTSREGAPKLLGKSGLLPDIDAE